MTIFTIYRATNMGNNKVYIGFDSSWPRRKSQHKNVAHSYNGTNNAFYNAIKKYGWDSFVWEVIYQSLDGEHTKNIMEASFIKEYNSYVYAENSNGYNMTLGGEGVLGYNKTKETIDSQRTKLQGRKQTPEHVAKRVATAKQHPNFGKPTGPRPPEFGEAIRMRMLGVPKTDEHRQAMRLRWQDSTSVTCPHCGKTGDYKNMKRWHMDNCKTNPNREIKPEKQIKCTVCGLIASESPNFYKNHNKNCKHP